MTALMVCILFSASSQTTDCALSNTCLLYTSLRVYFLEDRTLLDCLFHSVRDVVLRMLSKMNKTEDLTPGLSCVLHTFGRDLKWNPHIHSLISEGGAGNITPGRPVKHFD